MMADDYADSQELHRLLARRHERAVAGGWTEAEDERIADLHRRRADAVVTTSDADPTQARMVLYTLCEYDVQQINARRASVPGWCPWNPVEAGQAYPAMVVRTFGGPVANLQVFLDGVDTYWATSRGKGEPGEECKWFWPPHVGR